jgi:acyl-CoA thioesterase FadM
MHIFVRITRDDTVLATVEQMLLHVSNGRAAPARHDVQERALALVDGDVPDRVGRRIAMPA